MTGKIVADLGVTKAQMPLHALFELLLGRRLLRNSNEVYINLFKSDLDFRNIDFGAQCKTCLIFEDER